MLLAGEIDCREGISGAVQKGYYASHDAAIEQTASIYVNAIVALMAQYKMSIYVHPVCPPSNPTETERARTVQQFNETLRVRIASSTPPRGLQLRFLDFHADLCEPQCYGGPPTSLSLHHEFRCDGE